MRHAFIPLVTVAALACAIVLIAGPARAQTARDGGNDPLPPSASHDGKVQLLPPRPVADADDEVNRRVQAETVDGLVLILTIDGSAVTLDAVAPARVPKRQARSERANAGDVVRATAFANGQALATTVVPDTVLNASEGGGLVRTERRQIALALAVDRAVDSVAIEALATNARATLDVRAAYARICEADRSSKWCPRPAR